MANAVTKAKETAVDIGLYALAVTAIILLTALIDTDSAGANTEEMAIIWGILYAIYPALLIAMWVGPLAGRCLEPVFVALDFVIKIPGFVLMASIMVVVAVITCPWALVLIFIATLHS